MEGAVGWVGAAAIKCGGSGSLPLQLASANMSRAARATSADSFIELMVVVFTLIFTHFYEFYYFVASCFYFCWF